MPEFLTVHELAELLRVKERKVYDLAASGEVPCSRVTGKLLFPEREIRDWIAGGSSGGAAAEPPPAIFVGSHDPLLEWALRQSRSGLATFFDGSLDGLARFAQGEGIAAGLHLRDAATGDWNVPAARDKCAGQNAVLISWARRRRGLVIRPGERKVTGLSDISGRRVVPRQPEAGSQTLFSALLAEAGIAEDSLTLTDAARNEDDAVRAVAQNDADIAFGLESLAQLYGLGFVPVTEERFDLLVDRRAWFEPPMRSLMRFAASGAFRDRAASLAGYDVTELGTVRWNA